MKKKKILIVLLCMMLAFGITGCTNTRTNTREGYKDYDTHSKLIKIEGENDLYYYSSTHVMYIVFNECAGHIGCGYMAPYYSENGKLCTYDAEKKKIVEIDG